MRQPEEASMADAIQHVLVRQTEMVSADGCQYLSCAKYSFKRKKKTGFLLFHICICKSQLSQTLDFSSFCEQLSFLTPFDI